MGKCAACRFYRVPNIVRRGMETIISRKDRSVGRCTVHTGSFLFTRENDTCILWQAVKTLKGHEEEKAKQAEVRTAINDALKGA